MRPTIILCQDEEAGCLGALELVKTIPVCPVDLKYLIELDRAGYDDCVFYDCANKEFIKYVESCGFTYDVGSFSDISILAPAWGIAAVNLSIGYDNEHSYGEILHVDWMYKTIGKVVALMLSDNKAPKFEYIPAKKAQVKT